ncbi:MAG: PAS domain-containing protein [Proteobacteria bacterium]|nr:PAS domain-containing protein [Pseudomonadota bacterium]
MTVAAQTVDTEAPTPVSTVGTEAILEEIRVVQSVQTQRSMPVLLLGNTLAVAIVFYIDWFAVVSSYAVYCLGLELLLLLPMLRSYIRLRGRPRPDQVSVRRIRLIEIHSFLLGLVWAFAVFLLMPELSQINGAVIVMVMYFLGYGAVALTPSLPRASAAYFAPIMLVTFFSAYLNNVLSADLLMLIIFSGSVAIARTMWQSWQDMTTTVRLSLERLQAETALHRQETQAMRSMIEAIPFPLVLTRETGTVEATEQAARQFGIPAGEVSGLRIQDFFMDPAEQQKMADLQEERGRLEEYEVQLKNAQGKPFWALLSSLPLKYEGEDCWLNAIYVIDDRKRAEADLLDAKRRTEEANQTALEQNKMLETVSNQLAKYISPQLYQAIFSGEQKVEIESKRKKLTIFFSDIARFTEITDRLESEELTALLNQYLTEMSKIAQEHGATIDKFIGDAMVLYFGDPDTRGVREDAAACVRMAIAMQRRIRELQTIWRGDGLEQPFELRIGINTGYCTVGNFGSEDRMDHTIIGSEVNLAARLQSHADVGGILLANETHSLVKEWLLAEQGEAITVKGFPKPVMTFRVKGIYDELALETGLIHREQSGLTLTIDRNHLNGTDKANAIAVLEDVLAQLKD